MRPNEPLVTIAVFPTAFEASIAKGALEAIGIPALVPDETLGFLSRNRSMFPPTSELQVFESDRDRAIVELRRMQMRLVEPPGERD
jgi:hypothetical protein